MKPERLAMYGVRCAAATLASAGLAYAAHTAYTWLRYGHAPAPAPEEQDPLLDRFMPRYDIVDRLHVPVKAPADVTLATAERQDLMDAPGVRLIFQVRQFAMGAGLEEKRLPSPLIEQVKALGWGELVRVPGHEVVMGAVTQPWKGDVTFRSIPAEEFAAFREPGYVKIAWTLRADPVDAGSCIYRSETRAIATDEESRRRFRKYWSLVSPGVWSIRRLSAAPMRRQAEQHTYPAAA